MSMHNLQREAVCAGMRERKSGQCSGFTLIELLVTVALVGILSAIAVPLYAEYIEKARVVRAVSDIANISRSITAHKLENNSYPQSLNDVGYGAFEDPWGALYQYLNIETMGKHGQPRKDRFVHPINSDYDLYSMGRDGKSQAALTAHVSKDDVIRANDGAFIGLASHF
jgi:general secretion pathway protein G